MKRIAILAAGVSAALTAEIRARLAESGIDADVITDVHVVRDCKTRLLDVDDFIREMPPLVAPVMAEVHDDKRGDPQRDVAMLRREMLARGRNAFVKGKGRRR